MKTLDLVLEVLKIVAKIFNEQNISWVLAGSTASYLNGLDISPKDIDILTNKENANKIDNILSNKFEVLRRISYGETDVYASYFGRYKIKGIVIEVIGDLKIKYRGETFFIPLEILLKHSRLLKLDNISIKTVPLEAQLIYNLMIPNKEERARKIALFLNNSKKINHRTLKTLLNLAPSEIKEKATNLIKIGLKNNFQFFEKGLKD